MRIFNHNNSQVVLYLLNKEATRLPVAYLVQDTSLIIRDTSFYYMGLFVQDTNRYEPIVIPEFRRPDTSGLKNDTLKLFYSSDRMLRCLNNKLGGYFGFTYSIEDEQGNTPCFDGTRNHWQLCSDSGDREAVEKMKKLQAKQRSKLTSLVKRNSKKVLSRLTIKDNRDVNLYFFYRQYLNFAIKNLVYYSFSPGDVYYITFYYTFYLGNEFSSPQSSIFPSGSIDLMEVINTDLKENDVDTNEIFQGQLKSNKIMLLIK